ncbi:exosome complex protein Rrp42 [Candidatus Pacearchaeota archaeon]|nr:exosome complex protein Rrp42 [Candidatus Pacearchaeota archaeon]
MIKTPYVTGERIREYLQENKRFDNRKADEFREIEIELGVSKNAEGSAKVKIGKTEVLVGVKMSVGEPYPDSPDKGNLMVSAELLPLSSPRFESGPPKFPVIELGRVIDRGIRESKFIDFEKLCITKGEKVWTVIVDIYSINDDGNLLDAAGIGAIAALKNAKMPKFDKKEGKILYGEKTNDSIPLAKEIPISITVHKLGESLIVDPTREEEDISETRVTVGSSNGIISSIQKGNETSLKLEEFDKVLDIISKVERDVFKKLEKFLK